MKLQSSPGTNALTALTLMVFAVYALLHTIGNHDQASRIASCYVFMLWLFVWLLSQIAGLMETRVFSPLLRNIFLINICFVLLGGVAVVLPMFGR